MEVILDTNALSALAEGEKNLIPIISQAFNSYIPVTVIGEYRYGLKRSRLRKEREQWLQEIESVFGVLDVTKYTAQVYAQVRDELRVQGTPIPENDVWIAALVREHRMELVSQDGHFDYVAGLKRVKW